MQCNLLVYQYAVAQNVGILPATIHNIIKKLSESGENFVYVGQDRKTILIKGRLFGQKFADA